MRVEAPLAQQEFIEGDAKVANLIGVTPEFLGEMNSTWHDELGVVDLGNGVQGTADRFHVGPDDLTGGGGMKIKYYPTREAGLEDGYAHAKGMRDKAGALGHTDYAGRKSIINIDPTLLTPAQLREVMRQKARLMHEAGYTDPRIDKPAADEATGPYIDDYVKALKDLGVPADLAAASVTCKSDMTARGPATGRMAAAVQRVFMENEGRGRERVALQGAGFAGLYYAAEAVQPRYVSEYEIPLAAIGDLDNNRQPLTLMTTDPNGLAIDPEWADSLLLHPELDADLQHEKVRGNRLLAIARKLERAGVPFEARSQNVLTIDPELADCLTPAATSRVVTAGLIGDIGVKRWTVIANHVVDDAVPAEALAGYAIRPSELVSAGGLAMSFQERDRDMERLAAGACGEAFAPLSDAEYEGRVHDVMTRTARRIIAMGERFNLSPTDATVAVSLGNFAIARGAQVDENVRYLLDAPVAVAA
jgi:glutamate dehydrogenase/leucine dehydrogenase